MKEVNKVMKNFQTNFTTENAKKVQQLNNSKKLLPSSQLIVRQANNEEVEKFINLNSEPKTRIDRRYRKYNTKKLAKGEVAFLGDKMLNPVKLDISNLKELK